MVFTWSNLTKPIPTTKKLKLKPSFALLNKQKGPSNPSLVEKRIISRRDTTITKSNSNIIKVFNATRSTDWNHTSNVKKQIFFDVAHLNSAEAFNTKTGIFTIQKSGWYLFVFRSFINIPSNLLLTKIEKSRVGIYVLKNGEPVTDGGYDALIAAGQSDYADFNKFVRGNRGDKITVAALCGPNKDVKIISSNVSFTGYWLIEE